MLSRRRGGGGGGGGVGGCQRPCQDASIRPFTPFVDRGEGFLFLFVYSFKD